MLENGKIGYDVLLERTDAALVDFELDCGWAVAAGSSPIALDSQWRATRPRT
jgi:hypothetical protein